MSSQTHQDRMNRLRQAADAVGLEDHRAIMRANREAYREVGDTGADHNAKAGRAEDEMGDIILGDRITYVTNDTRSTDRTGTEPVTQPQPTPPRRRKGVSAGLAGAALLGTALAAGGAGSLIGMSMSQSESVETVESLHEQQPLELTIKTDGGVKVTRDTEQDEAQ